MRFAAGRRVRPRLPGVQIAGGNDMARGKYVHQSRGPRGPVLLLMLAVAVIAVVFAGMALVRAFHNEDPLPSLNGGQQQ